MGLGTIYIIGVAISFIIILIDWSKTSIKGMSPATFVISIIASVIATFLSWITVFNYINYLIEQNRKQDDE